MQIFRQEILNRVFALFLVDADSITDREVARKILLMVIISSVGVLMLSSLGTIAWVRQEFLLATMDYSVALILIGLLIYLRQSRNHVFCCYFGVFIMSLLYWYLFMSGAGARTSVLWLYTYPLFALFLLGARHGAMAIILFFIPCLVFLFLNFFIGNTNLYENDFIIRFVPSFLTVAFFAVMFEKSGENARKVLMDAQAVLEQRVSERTVELQHEITARKDNEEKLRNSEQQYRTLFDSNGDGVSIISAAGRFLEVNEELCHRLGYSREELLQMAPQDITSPVSVDQGTSALQELFARRKDSVVLEVEHVRRDGAIIPVELRAKKIFFKNEETALVVYRDITDRKKSEIERLSLESQLQRSQKMEVIGLMAGGVAHDLNNILSGVVTYPDLLLRQFPENHLLCESLKVIKESGQRASAVVADLLTVAKGVAHQKHPPTLIP